MAITVQGTYTQNNGDQPAAGTVRATHIDGTTAIATLDVAGAYTFTLATTAGTVTIVETITGLAVRTYTSGVANGATIDTSRDVGRVAFDTPQLAGPLGFFGATPIAKPTGVAVTAAAVHAALVSLGLIGV